MHNDPYFCFNQKVVSLNYLEALLARESMVAHYYQVTRHSDQYVTVLYSNPDEYGSACPVNMKLPCYWWGIRRRNTKAIVCDIQTVTGGRDSTDRDMAAEYLQHLLDEHEQLWRDRDGEWRTKEEIEARETTAQERGDPVPA